MKWTKFSEHFPAEGSDGILVYDGKQIFIASVGRKFNGQDVISSDGYYCNDPECTWIYDDCGCNFKITEDSWWMSLPKKPNIEGYDD